MAYYFTSIGNCNITHAASIKSYYPNMGQALADFFTGPTNPYQRAASRFTLPSAGIILFAQGSEDKISEVPYGPKLAELIEKYGLGEVKCSGPVPNILHNSKPGYLYMWVINREAIRDWYKKYVTPDGIYVVPAEELKSGASNL